jgi:O-glycosyl hydrolase
MVKFIDVLGPKLHALNPPVKLIAAEPDVWSDLWTSGTAFGPAILEDPTTPNPVDIFATHDYAFAPSPPPSGVTQHIWETEVAGISGKGSLISGPNVTIDNGVEMATWIANAITIGGASAWHHWWLVSQSAQDNEGLLFQPGTGPGDAGAVDNPPKRLFTLGNFSRFVRPGYVRIDVSGSLPIEVYLTAFVNPADGTLVVVAINQNTSDVSLPIGIGGTATPSQFTPWVTSATENLAQHPAVDVTGGSLTAALAAQTVTTFVSAP